MPKRLPQILYRKAELGGGGNWLHSHLDSDLSPMTGGQGSPLCPCCRHVFSPLISDSPSSLFSVSSLGSDVCAPLSPGISWSLKG